MSMRISTSTSASSNSAVVATDRSNSTSPTYYDDRRSSLVPMLDWNTFAMPFVDNNNNVDNNIDATAHGNLLPQAATATAAASNSRIGGLFPHQPYTYSITANAAVFPLSRLADDGARADDDNTLTESDAVNLLRTLATTDGAISTHVYSDASPQIPPHDAATSSSKTLTLAELRRKHNRESMQRMRQRERDNILQMRETRVALEREHRRALALQAAHVARQRDAVAPVLTAYHALANASTHLQCANFDMRQDLERRRKCYERVERILADYHLEKAAIDDEDAGIDAATRSPAPASVVHTPLLSEAEALALMTQCATRNAHKHRDTATHSTHSTHSTHPSLETQSPCFGWRVERSFVNSSSVHFRFTKTFARLDPQQAIAQAWAIYSTSAMNHMKPIRVTHFETLQVVNAHAHVVRRDAVHPRHHGVVLRSVFLRFRVETATGYAIGRACMNPPSVADNSSSSRSTESTVESPDVRYADLNTWLEVTYVDPTQRDALGCNVTFSGYCDYRTTYDLNARFMDVLFSVMQLENRVFEPLLPLLV